MRTLFSRIAALTGMGAVLAINVDDDYWFVDVLDKNYQLTGIQEFSSSLETALERIERRLLDEVESFYAADSGPMEFQDVIGG